MRDIEIDWDWVRKELIRIEHVRSNGEAGFNPKVIKLMEDALVQARAIAKPAYSARTYQIEQRLPTGLKISGVELKSKHLSQTMAKAVELIVFIVTVGDNIEKIATVFTADDDPAGGYMIDRTGSIAAESLAEGLERRLREEYESKGKSVSMRFSPGYCDWDTAEQIKMAKLVDFSSVGVTLTQGMMMVPKKSISGVIGIGPAGVFEKASSPCAICTKSDCDYRRK